MKPSPARVAQKYARVLNPESFVQGAALKLTVAARELEEAAKLLKSVRRDLPVAALEMKVRALRSEALDYRSVAQEVYLSAKEEDREPMQWGVR